MTKTHKPFWAQVGYAATPNIFVYMYIFYIIIIIIIIIIIHYHLRYRERERERERESKRGVGCPTDTLTTLAWTAWTTDSSVV